MSQEIELKLTVQPDELARLLRGDVLKHFGAGKISTRKLNTVYYDTPGLALAKTGLSLRVRKIGRNYVQTVKGIGTGALASDRPEWESALTSATPDLSAVPDKDLRERLAQLAADAPVEPKIETEIVRSTRQLTTPRGDRVELAIDKGEIRTLANGEARLPVAELELELKQGSVAALYEIARDLAEGTNLAVATESKAQRGMRALEGRPLCAHKAGRAQLDSNATAEEAFRATLFHCLRHIAQNAAVVQARDIEGVHQVRVGLRRLRAALTAFGDAFRTKRIEELRARAKTLGDKFGATRELDVFSSELLPPIEEAARTRPGITDVRLKLETLRHEAWNETVALVRSESFTGFLLDLAACIELKTWRARANAGQHAAFARPARELACESLDKRWRQAAKRAKHLSKLDTHDRHRLRIALKKLRYAAEFFAPLFPPKDVSDYLRHLSKTQDVFGALNDSATVDSILHRVLEHAGDPGSDLREGAAFVAGWHQSRVKPEWDKAKKRWKRLEKTTAFWKN